MKYKLLLSNFEDQKKPIIHLQSYLSQLICQLRGEEKKLYKIAVKSDDLEKNIQSIKELVSAKSEELNVRLRCFHDFQRLAQKQQAPAS